MLPKGWYIASPWHIKRPTKGGGYDSVAKVMSNGVPGYMPYMGNIRVNGVYETAIDAIKVLEKAKREQIRERENGRVSLEKGGQARPGVAGDAGGRGDFRLA